MTVVIGLMGPAGAGKSSVAQYLVEKYGATRYSFAEPLKTLAMRTLDFTHDQVWGTQAQKEAIDPRYGFSPRWFLQRLGTEGCRRTFGEDFWTAQTIDRIRREAPLVAVIEDARFVNEAIAIRSFQITYANRLARHGYVWRLDSPNRETSADATHASEQEWLRAPYDYLIAPPARGLDLLFRLVDSACEVLKLFPKRPELPL